MFPVRQGHLQGDALVPLHPYVNAYEACPCHAPTRYHIRFYVSYITIMLQLFYAFRCI